MKQKNNTYVSPVVEAVECKIEKGFQCSGGVSCDGGMLEQFVDGANVSSILQ